MVRELSKHQGAFLFDCCVFIARFASSSCYSSAKTRIRPVKSYQINESFCSITRCALLRIEYHFIVVSTHFRCPELQVRPLSSPRSRDFEPEPEPEPAFESHFRFFQSRFPFAFRFFQSRFPIAFLSAILLYLPFGLAIACKSHLTFESFTSYLTKPLSLTTALLLLAK